MRKRFIILLVILGTAFASLPAQVLRVAVLPFKADGIAAADARALTLFFETALQNTHRCEIVEQTQIDSILKAHEYALSDFNDPEKAIKIGLLIPANTIALGNAGLISGKPYVNVKMIDLKTGTVVAAKNLSAATVSDLATEFETFALSMLGVKTAPKIAESNATPLATPRISKAVLALFESGQGLPAQDQRIYNTTFLTASTRFINWDVYMEFSEPLSIDQNLPIVATFYRSNGSVLVMQTSTAYLKSGWGWFRFADGYGALNSNNWLPDTYTITVTLNGLPVATVNFIVR